MTVSPTATLRAASGLASAGSSGLMMWYVILKETVPAFRESVGEKCCGVAAEGLLSADGQQVKHSAVSTGENAASGRERARRNAEKGRSGRRRRNERLCALTFADFPECRVILAEIVSSSPAGAPQHRGDQGRRVGWQSAFAAWTMRTHARRRTAGACGREERSGTAAPSRTRPPAVPQGNGDGLSGALSATRKWRRSQRPV